jgi:hypothetical protein
MKNLKYTAFIAMAGLMTTCGEEPSLPLQTDYERYSKNLCSVEVPYPGAPGVTGIDVGRQSKAYDFCSNTVAAFYWESIDGVTDTVAEPFMIEKTFGELKGKEWAEKDSAYAVYRQRLKQYSAPHNTIALRH